MSRLISLDVHCRGRPGRSAWPAIQPCPPNARPTFDHVVKDQLQEMVDTNFELYKRVTDDGQFAKFLLDWLFERMSMGVE